MEREREKVLMIFFMISLLCELAVSELCIIILFQACCQFFPIVLMNCSVNEHIENLRR